MELNTVLYAMLQEKPRVSGAQPQPLEGPEYEGGLPEVEFHDPISFLTGCGHSQLGKTLPSPYLHPAWQDVSCVLLSLAATMGGFGRICLLEPPGLPIRARLCLLETQDFISSPLSHP